MVVNNRFGRFINSSLLSILVSFVIFLFVFFTPPDSFLNMHSVTYSYNSDTPSYLRFFIDPWRSMRSPGYSLFLSTFLEPHRERMNYIIKNSNGLPYNKLFSTSEGLPEFIDAAGLEGVFDDIVLCQRILLGLGAAFFVYACSLYINSLVVGGSFLLAVQVVPLVDATYILTESVAQPLSFFAMGLLLLFFKKSKFPLLFLGALCASSLYLVRPPGIYMLVLAGICWFYFFWKGHFHHAFKFFFTAVGFLPAIAYIGYISITSGYLMFGTHPKNSDLQFTCYYLQKEDINNMPTLRAREYARIYLDKIDAWKKDNAQSAMGLDYEDWPSTKSFGYRYNTAVWPLVHGLDSAILAELAKNPQIGRLSNKARLIMGRELKEGMLERHTADRIKTVCVNMLTGLGYYRDYMGSSLWKYGFPLIIGAWSVWCLALLLCPRVRFCLFLPGAAHLLHVFAIAYGNFILPRYIDLTETLFVFGVFLSLWSLVERLCQFYQKRYGDKCEKTLAAVM